MNIGCIKEIKNNENRVGLSIKSVEELVKRGHKVFIEKDAGLGSKIKNEDYAKAGAILCETPEEVCQKSDILVKVKEPIRKEYGLLEILYGKTLFTFLHLAAAEKELTEKLLEYKITSIAYETVKRGKRLPLLEPMSEIAGSLAVLFGGQYLQIKYFGKGKLLGKISNVEPANVVVIGGGVVGKTAAKKAAGLGANVVIIEKKEEVIKKLKKEMPKNVKVVFSNKKNLERYVSKADLLIGAVLVPGARAPKIVTREMVDKMEDGSVIVDVAIDQGGCIWGSVPTTHSDPIYKLNGKVYCCVTNMPGQVASDATKALTNATLPYLLQMADLGVEKAIVKNKELFYGVNTYKGFLTCEKVGEALGIKAKKLKIDNGKLKIDE